MRRMWDPHFFEWGGGVQNPHFSDTHAIIFRWTIVNLMSSPETETRFIRQLVVKADWLKNMN